MAGCFAPVGRGLWVATDNNFSMRSKKKVFIGKDKYKIHQR